MSIRIPYRNVKTKEQAFDIVKANITDAELAKWNVQAEIGYFEEMGLIEAKGKGFEITFDFLDDAIIADAKMSFLLKPIKNKILNYLENKVKNVV